MALVGMMGVLLAPGGCGKGSGATDRVRVGDDLRDASADRHDAAFEANGAGGQRPVRDGAGSPEDASTDTVPLEASVPQHDAGEASAEVDATRNDGASPGDASYGDGTAEGGSTALLFREIALEKRQACGILVSGEIHCWDMLGASTEPAIPAGPYVALAAGSDATCAIRAATGDIACWGDEQALADDIPTGPWTTVAVGSTWACAAAESGDVSCWGEGAPPGPEAGMRTVAAWGTRACGITTDGGVACWPAPLVSPALSTGFLAVDVGEDIACGLFDDGRHECFLDLTQTNHAPPAAVPLHQISLGESHGCGLDDENRVVCWYGPGLDELTESCPRSERCHPAYEPPGSFSQVVVHESTCALDGEGRAHCWGGFEAPVE